VSKTVIVGRTVPVGGSALLVVLIWWAPLSGSAPAQIATIPELLARAGTSLKAEQNLPSGYVPTVDHVLGAADVIAKGVVGSPHTYLSEDEREIFTDYPLLNPAIVYQSAAVASDMPVRPRVTITLLGGVYKQNGLTFTSSHAALPTLEPGTKGLFILRRVGKQYRIVGPYVGAFRIVDRRIFPLSKTSGFAPEYNGTGEAQATESLRERARVLAQRR
jgi:hypothetical protein